MARVLTSDGIVAVARQCQRGTWPAATRHGVQRSSRRTGSTAVRAVERTGARSRQTPEAVRAAEHEPFVRGDGVPALRRTASDRQTSRANSSFESRRPRVVRTTRSSAVTSSSSARAPSRTGRRAAAGGPRRSGRRGRSAGRGSRPRPPRSRGVERLGPPGGSARLAVVRRRERGEVAVEPGGVPAPGHAVERVRARPDRLVRPALPVRRGCAGSRGPAAPSC